MTVVLNPEHVSKGDGYGGRSRDEHVEGMESVVLRPEHVEGEIACSYI